MQGCNFDQLEAKTLQLLRHYHDLKHDNTELRKQMAVLRSEKTALHTKHQQAKTQIDQMIARLKNLEVEA